MKSILCIKQLNSCSHFFILRHPQVMSILAPQKYIDNKEEVLFARSPIPNFLNYLRRRRREKHPKKTEDDDDEDVLDDTSFDFDDSFDFAQFVRTHGHRIDHMIKKCRWKSQPCGPENFTAVITEFGLCYTFNSGAYSVDKYYMYYNTGREISER